MSLIKFTIQNDDAQKTKIANVTLYIYTLSATLVTSAISDNNGIIILNIPDGQYDCLFFKQGVTINQPQRLTIDPLLTNEFIINGHIRTLPESLDPVLCRVSGNIRSADGLNSKDIAIRFNPLPLNIIENKNFIFNDPVEVISDKKGYFQFDLIRGIKYEVSLPGYPFVLFIQVPNIAAINISDLLFPIPALLTTTATNITIPLSSGSYTGLGYTVTYTDLNLGKLYNDWSSIEVNYSVENKVSFSSNDTNFIIKPISLGSTSVSFIRKFNSNFIWINPVTFVSPILNINIV